MITASPTIRLVLHRSTVGAGAYASPEAGDASVTGFSEAFVVSAMSILPQQSLRTNEDYQQVDREHHGELPRGLDEESGQHLYQPHQNPRDERTRDAAEPA